MKEWRPKAVFLCKLMNCTDSFAFIEDRGGWLLRVAIILMLGKLRLRTGLWTKQYTTYAR
jgi:hypothetical protein